jgi:hypothetical protein
MNILHIFFLLFQLTQSVFLCSNCSKQYFYGTGKIGVCPSDYKLSGSTCVFPSYSILLNSSFSMTSYFLNSSFTNLTVSSGTFSTVGNPFPTKERGFYFTKNSFLLSSVAFIPSAHQTYDLYLRILQSGSILIIEGTSTFLEIKGKDFT